METYQEFLDRIAAFEKYKLDLGGKAFKSNPSLSQKVGRDNRFKKFYGDTVVFTLSDDVKAKSAEYAALLYRSVPQCFCEPLEADTFHLTLHDLSSASALRDIERDLLTNKAKIAKMAAGIRKYEDTKIKLRSKYIFNMVHTSLVLGVYPATAGDYDRLMELYAIFDGVKKLPYPFTPHITLAYYNIDGFDLRSVEALESIVNHLNGEMDMEIDVKELCYQTFDSMNHYADTILLTSIS